MNSSGRDEFKIILGKKLKLLRDMRDLNQSDVAAALNYNSSATISLIERGIKGMDNEQIYKAAKFFNVHPAYLFSPEEFSEEETETWINLMIVLKDPAKSEYAKSVQSLLKLAANHK